MPAPGRNGQVAEMTGRTKRMVKVDGGFKLVARNADGGSLDTVGRGPAEHKRTHRSVCVCLRVCQPRLCALANHCSWRSLRQATSHTQFSLRRPSPPNTRTHATVALLPARCHAAGEPV